MQSLSELLETIYKLLHADETIVHTVCELEREWMETMHYLNSILPINNGDGVKEAALMSMSVWDVANVISTLRNSFSEEIVCLLLSALTCLYYKIHDRRCYYQETWRVQEPSLFSLPNLVLSSVLPSLRLDAISDETMLTINESLEASNVINDNKIHNTNGNINFFDNAKHVLMCSSQQQQQQPQSVNDEAPLIHPRIMQFLLAHRYNPVFKQTKFIPLEHKCNNKVSVINDNNEIEQLPPTNTHTCINYFGDELTRHTQEEQKYVNDIQNECIFDGSSSTSREYDRLTLFCRSNMISTNMWNQVSNNKENNYSKIESVVHLLFNRKRNRAGTLIETVSLLPVKTQLNSILSSVHSLRPTILERLCTSF